MKTSEKICLNWKYFHGNVINAFECLRDCNNLFDVTMVSEDGKTVEAHDIIRAVSNPDFINLMKKMQQNIGDILEAAVELNKTESLNENITLEETADSKHEVETENDTNNEPLPKTLNPITPRKLKKWTKISDRINANCLSLEELDDNIKCMIYKSQRHLSTGKLAFVCQVCGKEGPLNIVMDHIATMHMIGLSHFCNLCGCMFSSRSALKHHTWIEH